MARMHPRNERIYRSVRVAFIENWPGWCLQFTLDVESETGRGPTLADSQTLTGRVKVDDRDPRCATSVTMIRRVVPGTRLWAQDRKHTYRKLPVGSLSLFGAYDQF